MKKSLVMLTFLGLATGVSYAQKQTTVKIQETQARILDVSPNAYVKPLTVELKVDTEGAKFLGNVDGQILTREAGGRVICVGTTSCRTLESWAAEDGHMEAKSGWTDIYIYPGYKFKVMDGLVTNFHLPESTLVMLVSAFADREKILNAYNIAVQERYRFFSFGDAMFLS